MSEVVGLAFQTPGASRCLGRALRADHRLPAGVSAPSTGMGAITLATARLLTLLHRTEIFASTFWAYTLSSLVQDSTPTQNADGLPDLFTA